MFLLRIALISLVAGFVSSQHTLSPIIDTKSGPIQGRLISLSNIIQVYEFTGIPFAEPPTGPLRFRKPEPKSPWTEVLNAANGWPNACPQFVTKVPGLENFTAAEEMFPKAEKLSEDCLYLNLWVPKAALDQRWSNASHRAIFTFIHGGGFFAGASSMNSHNGTILAGYNNIVVASIQYRLGSLGFAYLGTPEVPGNMGLWDQVEALKWICENAVAFGATCANHTIAGESAGAASVTYHLISSASRSYFTRAIAESGTALAPWAFKMPEALKAATELSFDSVAEGKCRDSSKRLDCLQQVPDSLFPFADLVPQMSGFGMAFVPTIDGDFLNEMPQASVEKGNFYKVPLLVGFNRDEGSIYLMMNPKIVQFLPMPPVVDNSKLDRLNFSQYESFIEDTAVFFNGGNPVPAVLSQAIQAHYIPKADGLPRGPDVAQSVLQAAGDHAITCPTVSWAHIASEFESTTVFTYRFSQRRMSHPWPQWMGVMHTDEIPYVFGEPFAAYARHYGYSNECRALSRVMMAYWTNFAKFGDPNIRDNLSPNLANGGLRLKPWPQFIRASTPCPHQSVELEASAQLLSNTTSIICGVKTRDCFFWSFVFPEIERLVMNQKEATTPAGAENGDANLQ